MQSKSTKKDPAATSMETFFLLDQCALIETRCGDIYRRFAEITADNPELETLWKKTAHEEDHHALQFKMLGRLREGILSVNADLSSLSAVMQKLESLFSQIETSTLTPVDTLRIGIKLEKYLGQYHANAVVTCRDPELTRLLNAMMKNDVEHEAMLHRALDKLLSQKESEHPA